MPSIRFYAAIADDVRKVVRRTVSRLQKLSPIPGGLAVVVCPAATVGVDDTFGFGMFGAPNNKPLIAIGGIFSRDMRKQLSRADWLLMLPVTISHEWVYAEQWRDGRPLNERGIGRRQKELASAIVMLPW